MAKDEKFRTALYEAVIFSFGKTMAKYDHFTQQTMLRDVGKEIVEYLQEAGFDYKKVGDETDIQSLFEMFIDHGFADKIESVDTDAGEKIIWHGLYGAKAYEKLHAITENPFLSCPLNACLLHEANKYDKHLELVEKKFDLAHDIIESIERFKEGSLDESSSLDHRTLSNAKLIEIAEQKQKELEEINKALKQSQQYLKMIIDNEPECVKIINPEYQLVDVNPAGLSMLEAESLQEAQSIALIEYVLPQFRDAFKSLYDKVMQGKRGALEVQIQGLKGTTRWIDTHAVPIYDAQGRVEVILAISRDITEYKASQKQIQEQNALIIHQARQAQMGEMISMIAHQWRQPITAISAVTTNLQLKISLKRLDEENFMNELKKIETYTKHLSSTIDDFREFFKPDQKMQEFELCEMIDHVLSLSESMLSGTHTLLKKDYGTHKRIYNFEKGIVQVLINLLKNAQDAIAEKRVASPKITISLSEYDETHVMIGVEDNAGGIEDGVVEKIFEPYYSTKSKNGTGLGLFMSKNIIEDRCGGRLFFENTQEGAKFMMLLPDMKKED